MTRSGALLATAGALLGVALLAVPLVRWTGAVEREQRCRVHLQRLGTALLAYHGENGRWPRATGPALWQALVDDGLITDAGTLRCPATATAGDGQRACDYAGWRAVPADQLSAADAATTLAGGDDDRPPGARYNHGDRRLLLYADGHVERLYFGSLVPDPRPADLSPLED